MKHALSLAALFLLASGTVCAQSSPSPPSASGTQSSSSSPGMPPPASSALPQDRHEGLTISVDSYTSALRAKDKFGKSANPVPAGILPVQVFLKNDTPHPIKINLESVQLDVRLESGSHQEIDWLTVGQVASLIVHPGGAATPSARRFPVGIPTSSKDKKVDSLAAELRHFALDSDVVPPLGAIHGFLFFNMSHDLDAAARASLYVPDVSLLPDQKPLMFFEVPLSSSPAPAADAKP
jgi:hypothetical protein